MFMVPAAGSPWPWSRLPRQYTQGGHIRINAATISTHLCGFLPSCGLATSSSPIAAAGTGGGAAAAAETAGEGSAGLSVG